MNVLACDRNGCENIMCDRISHYYGYICDECFDQLLGTDLGIAEFMETDKRTYHNNKPNRREELEDEFPIMISRRT